MTSQREAKRVVMRGLYPATLTPFAPDMSVDIDSLRAHLRTIASTPGVKGLVVNGGLGELLQLTLAEQALVIEETLNQRQPGQLVTAGLSASSVRRAVEEDLAHERARPVAGG